MSDFELTYKQFGERSILIEWPSIINEKVLYDVVYYQDAIKKQKIKHIVEVKSAYNSILVNYVYTINNFYDTVSTLRSLYKPQKTIIKQETTLWKIPVCYDTKFGLDLEELAAVKQFSKEEIISLHSEAIYTIYFIGFLPGFYYLGGLPEKLHQPRRASPRLQIKKGAVGIGGNQTGVYPNVSPGGWNIIGNSPINFFDVSKSKPCFGSQGDKIQFEPVSLKEYQDVKALVEIDAYQIKKITIND